MKHPFTSVTQPLAAYATASWLSLTATGVIVAVHHVYREGWQLLIPFAIIAALPYPLVRWFRATGSLVSLWAYALVGALTIGGFGFVDGFLDHVVNAFVGGYAAVSGHEVDRLERAFRVLPPTPLIGDYFYEGTGILEAIGAAIAAYYAYRFLRAAFAQRSHTHRVAATPAALTPATH